MKTSRRTSSTVPVPHPIGGASPAGSAMENLVANNHGRRGANQGVTSLELFYDLVFVFAITQVSHHLLNHLTWQGAGQSALLLMVVWWSWNYTTWTTNELDPEVLSVRLLMIALMLCSLLMAIALPEAFGDRALLFAAAYVTIQVGRHTFLTFAAADPATIERARAGRILTWFVFAGVFWILGAVTDGATRAAFWLIALTLDYGAPLMTFPVPGRQHLEPDSWHISTGHFAERFQLFVILALGETIVITGSTTSGLDLDRSRLLAFSLAFLSTVALWWLYFRSASDIGEYGLEHTSHRTELGRDAYTYLHVVIAAGIIVSAVGDELIIKHPLDRLPGAELVTIATGPIMYLLALAVFYHRLLGVWRREYIAGAAVCVLAAITGLAVQALVVGALLILILVTVIVACHVLPGPHQA